MKQKLVIIVVIISVGLCAYGIFWISQPIGGGDTDSSRAKNDIRNIESAISTYKDWYSAWPAELMLLTKRQPNGGGALLRIEALSDPWGRPYHYDPTLCHPETGIPLVWSEGYPDKPKAKIANWAMPEEGSVLKTTVIVLAVLGLAAFCVFYFFGRAPKRQGDQLRDALGN